MLILVEISILHIFLVLLFFPSFFVYLSLCLCLSPANVDEGLSFFWCYLEEAEEVVEVEFEEEIEEPEVSLLFGSLVL